MRGFKVGDRVAVGYSGVPGVILARLPEDGDYWVRRNDGHFNCCSPEQLSLLRRVDQRPLRVRQSRVQHPNWYWYCRKCTLGRDRGYADSCGYTDSCDEANTDARAHWDLYHGATA